MIARKEGGIGWMIFNQPEKHNAVSYAMWQAVPKIMADFEADPEVRVIVLTGAGEKAFVSGADISEFEEKRSAEDSIKLYDAAGEAAQRSLVEATKPTIAMIRGICIGGGLAIALNTDLRVCSDNSVFAVPAARLGLGYKYPGIARLVNIVGPAFAKEIFFTAGKFSAEDARIMGLVNRVVPVGGAGGQRAAPRRHHRGQRTAHRQGREDGDQCGGGGSGAAPARRDRCRHQGLLRQRGLHRGPPRLHGEAQATVQGTVGSERGVATKVMRALLWPMLGKSRWAANPACSSSRSMSASSNWRNPTSRRRRG